MTMDNTLTFKISIPTDNGFIGRECKNPQCKRYFKVFLTCLKDKMYCPYCGISFNKSELITNDQLDHATKVLKEEALAYATKRIQDLFKEATRGDKHTTFTAGGPYVPKHVACEYSEKQVDSEIECSQCKVVFQVYGIFGYCPACRCDNILIYDTNIQKILKQIGDSYDKKRDLRHAYDDLVSTFEHFCKDKNTSDKKYNFQNLGSVECLFHELFNIDMFNGLSPDEMLCMKRVFAKRNVYQHNKGIVDQKYTRSVPEDSHLLYKEAPLAPEELVEGAQVMRKILIKIL